MSIGSAIVPLIPRSRILLLATLIVVLVAPTAEAKIIFVNSSGDVTGFVGICSLRDAVRSANDNVAYGGCSTGEAGLDEIYLPALKLAFTRTGKYDDTALYGDLDVVSGEPLIVRGHAGGSTIDAAGIDRVFEADAPLTLEDFTIIGGRPGPDGTLGVNPNKSYGGAVLARDDLTMRRMTFEDNATADGLVGSGSVGGNGGAGGAIAADGFRGRAGEVLTVTDSVFRNNRTGAGAAKPPGGIAAGGGGAGGALVTISASATVSGSRFTGNRTGPGGAGGGGSATGGAGAAIFLGGPGSVTNTLISGNTMGAWTPSGGAASGAVVGGTLRHVTIAANAIDGLAGNDAYPNGVYNADVSASILMGSGRVCQSDAGVDNISPVGSGCGGQGSDPGLDENFIPAADSRAIDHVSGTCPATDLRGITRPQGLRCDAGAIERRPSVLTLAPGSLSFPSLLPGAVSGPRSLQFTYAGDGALKLQAGALSTTGDFAASGCSGMLFVDAGSCAISVTFAPTLAGARAGTVTLATPAGPRSAALDGTGIAAGSPSGPGATPPPGSSNGVARASLAGVSLRRVRGRLLLRVTLRCKAIARCDESLRIRVRRPGRSAFFATRAERIAPGARHTETVALPRRFVRGLRTKAKLGMRLRLVKRGQPITELLVTRSAP